ncbi:LamG-like jellyroll fold domain-containing protein [Mesorhizobium sp.]|uniref:LamG-like jellyroll fold domain-containing protein n=1 Tax=Mesorhizobium sp. TaxID=1871066 RepID=UPI0025F9ACD6|nr:LamG-like jellyroll fold domain-containing protein [Mesorhizobium sp.]
MFIAKLGEAITDPAGVPQALAFLPSLIGDAQASLYLDFADLTRMWNESTGVTPVDADADLIGKVSSPYGAGYAFQATAGQLGTYRTSAGGVLRLDGSNDWMDVANFLFASTGGNTVAMKITPTAGSAGRSFFGFATSNRFQLTITAAGYLWGLYGTGGTSAVVGTVDIRGTTFVVTMTHDDDTLYLYRNDTLVGTAPLAGTITTSVGPAIGVSKNGTGAPSGGYIGADIRKVLLLAGRTVTAEDVAEIVANFG